jgi:DNA-binding NtrC family response regulator
MSGQEIVKGKRILAVDDEPDVLEVIKEELALAEVSTARDFGSAKDLIEREEFDLVILDIMGVRGLDLLNLTTEKKLPAVMLTAHAMTPDSLQKSIDRGAVSFLPKDELAQLPELIGEILQDLQEGRTHWPRLIDRLGPTFKRLWGEMWDEIKFPDDSRLSW